MYIHIHIYIYMQLMSKKSNNKKDDLEVILICSVHCNMAGESTGGSNYKYIRFIFYVYHAYVKCSVNKTIQFCAT